MSLSELLPAMRALPRAEKAELLHAVANELAKDDPVWWYRPGEVYDGGSGLHDSHEAAAILMNVMHERKSRA